MLAQQLLGQSGQPRLQGEGLGRVVGEGVAGGRSILIATVAAGIDTMKMINSTSITSTKGVTLMSAF